MAAIADFITLDIFRRIVGMKLEKVAAHGYPSYFAYNQIVVQFSGGLSIRIDLVGEKIGPMFEVFMVRARLAEFPADRARWDLLEIGEFVVSGVFVLRREEWIERFKKRPHEPLGKIFVEQKAGSIDAPDARGEAVVVDSGVCIVSTHGAELNLDADTFPFVLQLRYEIAPSSLPHSSRIAVNSHRLLQ